MPKVPYIFPTYERITRINKDLPPLPEFFSGDNLVIKEDFYRLNAIRFNRRKGQYDASTTFTVYYNIFALAFGYDTIEIYYINTDGTKRHIKFINLYEKMSSQEQEIINYIAGTIKHMENLNAYLGNEELNRYRVLFDSSTDPSTPGAFSNIKLQTITDKFSNVFTRNGKAYLYKNSYFEDSSDLQNVSELKIPFTSFYKDITLLVNNGTDELTAPAETNDFQKSCFNLIRKNIDPLQVFIKSNFVKSINGREKLSNLNYDEMFMIASFMKNAGISVPSLVDSQGRYTAVDSKVTMKNTHSNLKKIAINLPLHRFDEEDLVNLRISLIKRKKPDDALAVINGDKISTKIKQQSPYCDIGKTSDLGNFPINIVRKRNPSSLDSSFAKDIAIERDQFLDETIRVYSSHRVVSQDTSLNSGFLTKDLVNPKLISTIDLAAIGDTLLKRDIILNDRTGEILVNSTISSNKALGIYNKSAFEQRISNLKFYVTTISGTNMQGVRFPRNEIKILNKHKEIKIKKVICHAVGSDFKFNLPFQNRDIASLTHVDPIPGAKYKYEIWFCSSDGVKASSPIEVLHRTFSLGPNGLSLNLIDKNENAASIEVVRDNPASLAENISNTLENIFSGRAASFYEEFFKEKVNKNLQNIGKIYHLYVEFFDKKSGFLSSEVVNPVDNAEGRIIFNIPVGGNLSNNIISYNLAVANPLEIVSSGFEEIEGKNREKFLRRTAAFFNTFTLTNGTLQREVIEEESGNRLFAHNSRFRPTEIFNRVSCIGGMIEEDQEESPNLHSINSINHVYNPDDGECIISWRVKCADPNSATNLHIDFFIITSEINGIEFPIGAHPFVLFNRNQDGFLYKFRTNSFLGVASSVKFRVYTVYNDYKIQNSPRSVDAIISDSRKIILER